MKDRIITALLNNQNLDGGWGATRSRHSNTESTSLALTALKSLPEGSLLESISGGTKWLIQHQNQDGSWPLSEATKEGSWTTALAITALSAFPKHQQQALSAARWLLQQEGSKPGILAQLILVATGKTKVNELNSDLIGWSWVPNSFSWVEPTSYALTALKKVRSGLGGTNVNDRIRQAEAMIYDRMCKGGGWNYGNSKVLDYALWPYPDITAVALIALQDHSTEKANQESLQTLRKIARETDSGLSLSWGAICLALYGQDTSDWRVRIEKRFEQNELLGETKALALALLALHGDPSPFRI
jgi:hypothetical protein